MHMIYTEEGPSTIGTYSQAINAGNMVFFSGQIALDPIRMEIISADFKSQAMQVFKNLETVALAAHGSLRQLAKITVYLTHITHTAELDEVMKRFFQPPYPACATIEVSALPRQALIEVDAIMVL